jgi:hypothetical protein
MTTHYSLSGSIRKGTEVPAQQAEGERGGREQIPKGTTSRALFDFQPKLIIVSNVLKYRASSRIPQKKLSVILPATIHPNAVGSVCEPLRASLAPSVGGHGEGSGRGEHRLKPGGRSRSLKATASDFRGREARPSEFTGLLRQ